MPTVEPALALADAIVSALNAKVFSLSFNASREYLPRKEIRTSTTLAATVMPIELDSEISTRRDDKETHTIAVALHVRPPNTLVATIDPLMNLTREVHDFLRKFATAEGRAIRRRSQPRYDFEALQTTGLFLAFIYVDCLVMYTPPEDAE